MSPEKISAQEMLSEKEKREADIAILESTEGWRKLTNRQQRLIQSSLYIQARAERGTDPASRAAIESKKFGYLADQTFIMDEKDMAKRHSMAEGPDPQDRAYRSSQNHIADWYCHVAVMNLESQTSLGTRPEEKEDFFKAEYRSIHDSHELASWIENFGFPAILYASAATNPADSGKITYATHTCVALGHKANGDILVWEKYGPFYPYRLASLEEIYKDRKDITQWGLRKLLSKPS